MSYRVVVTGHTAEGRSVCLRDDKVAETPGWMVNFWITETSPADNTNATDASVPDLRLAPTGAGSLFRLFCILPDNKLAAMTQDELDDISRKIGVRLSAKAGERLWHRTETVDYVTILSGRVTLHLDDGDVDLNPHDVVIQRGTHHAWSNKTDETAVAVCVMIGADPLAIQAPTPAADRLMAGA